MEARRLVRSGRTSVSPSLMREVVEYAQALLQLFGWDMTPDPDAVRTTLSAVERCQITVLVRLRNMVRAAAAREQVEAEALTQQLFAHGMAKKHDSSSQRRTGLVGCRLG